MPRGWRNGKSWAFPLREIERFEEEQMAEAERQAERRVAPIRRARGSAADRRTNRAAPKLTAHQAR